MPTASGPQTVLNSAGQLVEAQAIYDALSSPVTSQKAVTPNDGADLPDGTCRAIWVGGGGNVSGIAEDDTLAVVTAGIAAGTLLPIRFKRINSTNTTATLIVAWY